MLEIYTAWLPKHREAMDITVKGGSIFAPSWEIVMGLKEGSISSSEYEAKYTQMMRKSYLKHKEEWLSLCRGNSITLGCYCRPHEFCHRYLLVEMLIKTCKFHGIEVTYRGELK